MPHGLMKANGYTIDEASLGGICMYDFLPDNEKKRDEFERDEFLFQFDSSVPLFVFHHMFHFLDH